MARRFNPANYDPTIDSSPGSYTWRPDANNEDNPDGSTGFEGLILIVHAGECACGCGWKLANDKAEFLPGHDAKLKGKLIRAHLTGTEVTLIDGAMAVGSDAMLEAEKRGWGHFLLASAAAKARKATKKVVEAVGDGSEVVPVEDPSWVGDEVTFKDGRWERVGQVVTDNGAEIEVSFVVKGESKIKLMPKSKVTRGDADLPQDGAEGE